jgi:hypothetical protein
MLAKYADWWAGSGSSDYGYLKPTWNHAQFPESGRNWNRVWDPILEPSVELTTLFHLVFFWNWTQSHKFVLFMYLCFYNTLTMSSKLNAN